MERYASGSAYAYYSRNILGSCEYIAQMVNDCGYDFYTLGNHDFNYGQEYQAIYRNNHKGICVCENVLDSEGNILYPHMIQHDEKRCEGRTSRYRN